MRLRRAVLLTPQSDLPPPQPSPIIVSITPFRINTCKSVSKQRISSSFRINTYEKPRGGCQLLFTRQAPVAQPFLAMLFAAYGPWNMAPGPLRTPAPSASQRYLLLCRLTVKCQLSASSRPRSTEHGPRNTDHDPPMASLRQRKTRSTVSHRP